LKNRHEMRCILKRHLHFIHQPQYTSESTRCNNSRHQSFEWKWMNKLQNDNKTRRLHGRLVSRLNETEERMAMKVHMIALQHDCSVRLSENFVYIVESNETANVELESIQHSCSTALCS
jgi:hypothetical protein